MLELFSVEDKELRNLISRHIISDMKRMNKHAKNHAINKTIKNLMFEILKQNSDSIAKRCLLIMIELYKSNIWNDEKTVNIIANGCFNDNHKLVLASCRFLIETTQNL